MGREEEREGGTSVCYHFFLHVQYTLYVCPGYVTVWSIADQERDFELQGKIYMYMYIMCVQCTCIWACYIHILCVLRSLKYDCLILLSVSSISQLTMMGCMRLCLVPVSQ